MSPPYTSAATRRSGSATGDVSSAIPPPAAVGATVKPGGSTPDPLYWRLLRLTAVRPNGWQRAVLVEGITAIAVILTLADVASAWTLLVLPLAAALIVKAHDYLAQSMPQAPHASAMSDAGNTGDGAGAAGAEKPR